MTAIAGEVIEQPLSAGVVVPAFRAAAAAPGPVKCSPPGIGWSAAMGAITGFDAMRGMGEMSAAVRTVSKRFTWPAVIGIDIGFMAQRSVGEAEKVIGCRIVDAGIAQPLQQRAPGAAAIPRRRS